MDKMRYQTDTFHGLRWIDFLKERELGLETRKYRDHVLRTSKNIKLDKNMTSSG